MQTRKTNIIYIGAFLGLFMLFAVGTFLRFPEKISPEEARSLAQAPKLRLKQLAEFPDAFEKFFKDRMLARTDMVKVRAWAKYVTWGVSGSDIVMIGRDGWIYLVWAFCAGQVRHETLFSQNDLEVWKRVLQFRTKWFAQRGIKYVFAVAPDKDTIYPEFLPEAWRPVRSMSKLDQLTAYLKGADGITFINLAETLRQNKGAQYLYYKADTHWNDLGAYIGYKQLIAVLNSSFPVLASMQPCAVQVGTKQISGGDCSRMAVLPYCFCRPETVPTLKVETSAAAIDMAKEKPELAKAALIVDSFGEFWRPFLKQHFGTIVYHHQTNVECDLAEIAKEKPNIVIHEVVERHASYLIPRICSWTDWVTDTIAAQSPKGSSVWLNIVPHTAEVNVAAFKQAQSKGGCVIKPTTSRIYSTVGEKVAFDEQAALYHDWYLLKTGTQGEPFLDVQSTKDYRRLVDFVANGGRYQKADECPMSDGTTIMLYHKNSGTAIAAHGTSL